MKSILTLLSFSVCMILAGCNTIKGVGQDIQKAGEKIEDVGKKK